MSKLPDMQRAVNEVSGVASATMRWPEPEGPAFMRIEFEGGADQGVVAERVLEVLRQAGGTDMPGLVHGPEATVGAADAEPIVGAAAEPTVGAADAEPTGGAADAGVMPPTGVGAAGANAGAGSDASSAVSMVSAVGSGPSTGHAQPSAGGPSTAMPNGHAHGEAADRSGRAAAAVDGGLESNRCTRPVLERMSIERTRLDTTLQVTLDLAGRRAEGRATASRGERRQDRVAAEATLAAVCQLLPATVRIDLHDVATTERAGPGPTANVWLTRMEAGRQEDTVGSAIVRHDLADAVARATLDAVNRWLPVFLQQEPDRAASGAGGGTSARTRAAAAGE